MNKKSFFEEYAAPEMEIVLTTVEAGFTASAGFEDVTEDNYGEF